MFIKFLDALWASSQKMQLTNHDLMQRASVTCIVSYISWNVWIVVINYFYTTFNLTNLTLKYVCKSNLFDNLFEKLAFAMAI